MYKRYDIQAILLCLFLILTFGCMRSIKTIDESSLHKKPEIIPYLGYAIQIGAFSMVENAARTTISLQEKGFDAYYFLSDSNLYKVRFGNYPSLDIARDIAEKLRLNGTISEYLIIRPEDYTRADINEATNKKIRKGIVLSAQKYLGVPYSWGGASNEIGFDCSGLAMAVYKLNGLNLPRTTNEQWALGTPVDSQQISEGDLVFFSTKTKGKVSHVGIYIGNNNFIHAPEEGKKIRTESLLTEYFQSHYMGARTFFR